MKSNATIQAGASSANIIKQSIYIIVAIAMLCAHLQL